MAEASGASLGKAARYDLLYAKALEGSPDCGGLVNFNYYSGEPITGVAEGRPLFVRAPNAELNLANFMRAQLYSALATLKIGMDTLTVKERIRIERLTGHGGLFKTEGVGQALMASALGVPVAVMETAGEGGAWGMAVLAAYMRYVRAGEGAAGNAGEGAAGLDEYLSRTVFAAARVREAAPDPGTAEGFAAFMQRYVACLPVERAAIAALKQ
jgi:sugar (pentulose or hexulose) kinase